MAKRLVVCFDGTWNSPQDGADDVDEIDKGAETNVIRLYRSILGDDTRDIRRGTPRRRPAVETVKWYDQGVGAKWYEHIRGGAFGYGLSRNIREGYKFLVDHYTAGCDIYIFGFSRGAYTARSLVGLIRNVGLLKKQFARKADPDANPILMDGYQIYRARDGSADTALAKDFRDRYSHVNVKVKVLGVWDTVGALGIPVKVAEKWNVEHYQFHDTKLSGIVENAFHAVAIDEHRDNYKATLWDPPKATQRIEQVWFPGAHSDVGGGYPAQPLSDVALHWMQSRAKLDGQGLEIDPRLEPDPEQVPYDKCKVTDSFSEFLFGFYRLFKDPYYRPVFSTDHGRESLHEAYERMLETNREYAPKNTGL
jgi:uncharacterized protein (DUF2235 family)